MNIFRKKNMSPKADDEKAQHCCDPYLQALAQKGSDGGSRKEDGASSVMEKTSGDMDPDKWRQVGAI